MLEAVFWVSVGLVIGWNVLPQPIWAENLYLSGKNTIRRWITQDDNSTS